MSNPLPEPHPPEERKTRKRGELRSACLDEAALIIAEQGVEGLSLREVARRLGVSHQAPYKHFPSRDHLLAEVVARGYERFAEALDQRDHATAPHADLGQMGLAYIRYAQEHPLEYRLIFGTPLPNLCEHPDMAAKARHAFDLLRDALIRAEPKAAYMADLDALFVWSTVHGLVAILQTPAIQNMNLADGSSETVITHVLGRIGRALRSVSPN